MHSVVPFIIPALNAAASVAHVAAELLELAPGCTVFVIDDGSKDDTATQARAAGASVVSHGVNKGKGAALLTGFRAAERMGASMAVTLDADGQHAAADALALAAHSASADSLVLGVRDLAAAGAPSANQFSNKLSNFFLSGFSGRRLRDTQCGLRRYPVARALAAGTASLGFEFESEVVLIAALRGWPIEQVPVSVYYPPEAERVTHFHNVRDPAKIVVRVVGTVVRHHLSRSKHRSVDSQGGGHDV